jgi:hypothetical protein
MILRHGIWLWAVLLLVVTGAAGVRAQEKQGEQPRPPKATASQPPTDAPAGSGRQGFSLGKRGDMGTQSCVGAGDGGGSGNCGSTPITPPKQ